MSLLELLLLVAMVEVLCLLGLCPITRRSKKNGSFGDLWSAETIEDLLKLIFVC